MVVIVDALSASFHQPGRTSLLIAESRFAAVIGCYRHYRARPLARTGMGILVV